MSADEFLDWTPPFEQDKQWQLVFGQPVFDMAPPGTDHGAIQANLARLVGNHLERQSGRWSATERVDADGLLALPPVGFEAPLRACYTNSSLV